MSGMANHGPRRPKRPSVPSIAGPLDIGKGAGSRFSEHFLGEPDLGGGLPRAPYPVIAQTPEEVATRANQKRVANRRTSRANNVRGYVVPGPPGLDYLPSAQDLLLGSQDQTDASDVLAIDQFEGAVYTFPQVSPTKTINPQRPRTLESGYDPETRTLRVRFRDGTPWEYYDVPPEVWQNFKRVQSPGRMINRTLNNYDYGRGNF